MVSFKVAAAVLLTTGATTAWQSNITPFGQMKIIQTSSIASSRVGYNIVNDRKRSSLDMAVSDPTKEVPTMDSGGMFTASNTENYTY